jgi:hypothetical protein
VYPTNDRIGLSLMAPLPVSIYLIWFGIEGLSMRHVAPFGFWNLDTYVAPILRTVHYQILVMNRL